MTGSFQFDLSQISKSFGAFQVLENVSLKVEKGTLCGLIGPNGAGKSTLFAIATGIISSDRGRVHFNGSDITSVSAVRRARLGLARTFQIPREFRHLTVHQNLAVAAVGQSGDRLMNVFFRPSAVRKEEIEISARVDRLIDFLGLRRVRDTAAGNLSGGQKKLLELGRALMLEPQLVLLDEPFAGVNPIMISEICSRIRTLCAQGISFLIVEHNLPALSSLVATMYVMDHGRIIGYGAPDTILKDEKVRDAYLGGAVAACC